MVTRKWIDTNALINSHGTLHSDDLTQYNKLRHVSDTICLILFQYPIDWKNNLNNDDDNENDIDKYEDDSIVTTYCIIFSNPLTSIGFINDKSFD